MNEPDDPLDWWTLPRWLRVAVWLTGVLLLASGFAVVAMLFRWWLQ